SVRTDRPATAPSAVGSGVIAHPAASAPPAERFTFPGVGRLLAQALYPLASLGWMSRYTRDIR
ncbi:hypothetical protein, partial [Streptomyces sp. NPDC057496]|uniref:hypothetical protein n=1 Tax=Streptomyces sp. NPDC057496 TaxID=3346149 RepID=UPI0036BA6244